MTPRIANPGIHVADLRAGRARLEGTRLRLFVQDGRAPAPAAPGGRHDAATQQRRDRNGRVGEDVLELLHDVCRRAGVADVTKIATPMQIRGRYHAPGADPDAAPDAAPLFIASFARKAGVDYRGVMTGDGSGRAVFVEAKFLEGAADRYSLAHVRPVQRAQLDLAVRAGAVAVLVIVRGPRREVFALPWAVAREHVSLGERELRPWHVRVGTPYLAHFAWKRGDR